MLGVLLELLERPTGSEGMPLKLDAFFMHA